MQDFQVNMTFLSQYNTFQVTIFFFSTYQVNIKHSQAVMSNLFNFPFQAFPDKQLLNFMF